MNQEITPYVLSTVTKPDTGKCLYNICIKL